MRGRQIAAVALSLALLGCQNRDDAVGSWEGTYDTGEISAFDYDVISHEIVAAEGLQLELGEDGRFVLFAGGPVQGDWDFDDGDVVLVGEDANGDDIPEVRLELVDYGDALQSEADENGAVLRFTRIQGAESLDLEPVEE